MHNRLSRTSIGHQCHHNNDEGCWLAQALKHRACSGAKGLPTYLAAIWLPRFPMADNIALAHFPSCTTVPVRAKYLGCIPLFCVVFFHIHSVQMNALLFHSLGPFVPPEWLGESCFL